MKHEIADEQLAKDPQALTWKYFHAMVLFGRQHQTYLALLWREKRLKLKNYLTGHMMRLIESARIGEKLIEKSADTVLFFTGLWYMVCILLSKAICSKQHLKVKGMDYHEIN